MADSIVSVNNLSKSFDHGRVTVFQDLSIEIPKNKVVGLIGPNGSGKTTFIKLISGMILPDDGEIFVDGHNILKSFSVIKKMIAVVSDSNRALYWNLSGYENIQYFAILKGLYNNYNKSEGERVIEQLISELNMENFIFNKVNTYSKGMRQKLILLMALLNSPKLLLLDEPLNGLDFENALIIKDIIINLAQKGVSIIISSHDKYFLEEICDLKYAIKDKKIVFAPRDIFVSKKAMAYVCLINPMVLEQFQEYHYEIVDYQKNIYAIEFGINDYNFFNLIERNLKNKFLEILSIIS